MLNRIFPGIEWRAATKRLLQHVCPGLLAQIVAIRSRRLVQSIERRSNSLDLSRRWVEVNGRAVCSGPFQGLRFETRAFKSHYGNIGPKLIGTYEAELHPIWEEAKLREWTRILDIGSAEGYYAVGFARQFPKTEIHAFDTDPWARRLTKGMAAENAVSNLTVTSYCSPEWFLNNVVDGSGGLLLCDCEGYEAQLFTQEVVRCLSGWWLVIELHEGKVSGLRKRLLSVIASTHHCTVISASPRVWPVGVNQAHFTLEEQKQLLDEMRTDGQAWLVAKPHCGVSSHA